MSAPQVPAQVQLARILHSLEAVRLYLNGDRMVEAFRELEAVTHLVERLQRTVD